EKGGVTQREQPRIAHQHHERDAANAVDEDPGDLTDIIARQQGRQQQNRDGQQAIPHSANTVGEEADVLLVGSLEQETHRRLYTFLRPRVPNRPCGRTASMTNNTMYGAVSLKPSGSDAPA